MKKIILTLVLAILSLTSFAQYHYTSLAFDVIRLPDNKEPHLVSHLDIKYISYNDTIIGLDIRSNITIDTTESDRVVLSSNYYLDDKLILKLSSNLPFHIIKQLTNFGFEYEYNYKIHQLSIEIDKEYSKTIILPEGVKIGYKRVQTIFKL